MHVIGKTPTYNYISNFIARFWHSVTTPELYFHEDGFYIAKFHNRYDRDKILYSGPYTINSMPLILKDWTPYFYFQEEFPRTMPLWVNFLISP